MAVKCGIVGLPNVGKSTLFNALSSAKAEAANYPFCTIEPNIGVVNVPDKTLLDLSAIFKPEKITPAVTQFVDIAGIVKGASQGEGLGNQFLAHIREADAIAHIVRCFEHNDIVHVSGSVDPKRDIEVINTELLLADLQSVEKRLEREKKGAKSGNKEILKQIEILERLKAHLDKGQPARTFVVEPLDKMFFDSLFLLTQKPMLYVANATSSSSDQKLASIVEEISKAEGTRFVQMDCGIEAEIAQLPEADRAEYLKAMGLEEPGMHRFIRTAFDLLGLMFYYTAGPKEVRAWTIRKNTKAPQAAGEIHTDFEKGFICADCYNAQDLLRLGTELKLREAGLLRTEGREYVVQPGDVMLFKFNVSKGK